jgi:hypothetical protein
VIHHGMTAELSALRIAELHAEAEHRRRRTEAAGYGRRLREPLSTLFRGWMQRLRPSITLNRRTVDSTAEQRA